MSKPKNKLHKVSKKITLYIKYVFNHWKTFAIGCGSLILITGLGFGIYKYITTPRAPNFITTNNNYLYTAKGQKYTANIGSKENNRPEVNFTVGEGSIVFAPASGSESLSEPKTDGKKTVIFENVYENIDYRYQTIPLGIKEEIIIRQPTIINTFPFYIDFSNVEPQYYTDNIKGTAFYDKDGKYLFNFERPFAFDAKGARTDNVGLTIKKDTGTGKYVAIVSLDNEWMKDPTRAYPITIDPTIVHDESTEFSSGDFDRSVDSGSGSSPRIESYYQELFPDAYTVGLWHMNNSWNDSSGKSNNLTASGNASFTTTSVLGTHAGTFDGSGDYASIASNSTLNFGTNPFTIEAWIKSTSTAQPKTIVMKRTTAINNMYWLNMGFGTVGKINFYTRNSAGTIVQVTSNKSVDDGSWHHVAAVRNSVGVSIYIDGVFDKTTFGTAVNTDNTESFVIGEDVANGAASSWDGQIDEVKISNLVRSSEEIAVDASRRPYSTYTSDAIDLSDVATWNSLYWNGLGIATGDGENATPSATSNLVAQWNFNETSGTTAASGGSCGSSCDGTLANFASTGSQDAATGTGWTAINRRWGAGALMFDGSNDSVSIPTSSVINFSSTDSYSIETWFNTTVYNATSMSLVEKWAGSGGYPYVVRVINGLVTFAIYDGTNNPTCSSISRIDDGLWHHVVGIKEYSSDSLKLYLDGKFECKITDSTTASISSTSSLYLGSRGGTTAFFKGNLDSPKIYSRVLTDSEILSNYNSSRIELQTRVGESTDPNDGTWEKWKPVTNETQISSLDSPITQINDRLISYWKLDETSAGSSAVTRIDSYSNNNLTDSNTVPSTTGVLNNGASYTAANLESLMCTDAACGGTGGTGLDLGGINPQISVSAWFNTSVASGTYGIVGKKGGTGLQAGYLLVLQSNYLKCTVSDGSYMATKTSTATYNDGVWHNAVCLFNMSGSTKTIILYVDGAIVGTSADASTVTGSLDTTSSFSIGSSYASNYFTGYIDEVGVWGKILTPQEIVNIYNSKSPDGLTNIDLANLPQSGGINSTNESVIKMEGTASDKITIGQPIADRNTVALWHLDETGGSGAYIKDASSNANNGTPTGTTLVEGVSGKARNFNGSSDKITLSAEPTTGTGSFTIEAWIKTSSTGTSKRIISYGSPTTTNAGVTFLVNTSNQVEMNLTGTLGPASSVTVTDGKWHHAAVVNNAGTVQIYVDGAASGSSSAMTPNITTGNKYIGVNIAGNTNYFNGTIDELRVSNTARSAEEIAESYRMGVDHFISKAIPSKNLSSASKLPFYVASDRLGTFSQLIIGESVHANYEPDTNTVGLWHLDEQSGSGAYIKDSSGKSNHGTPTGTTFVQGKIGKGRNLNGSSNYISINENDVLDPSEITIEAWIKPNVLQTGNFVDKGGNNGYRFRVEGTAGNLGFYDRGATNAIATSVGGLISSGKWSHVVAVGSSSGLKIYVNGQLVASNTTPYGGANTSNNLLLGRYGLSAAEYYSGDLDEVRISNTARSADEIRQAYEIGARTHNITIDFKAKLDSGNLITGSSDTSFTVDETPYGSSAMANHVFTGDKIIVKENYDGTEYIAQGTVNSVNSSTGAVSVTAWDDFSTFPASGFTTNATVFKWQREYFDLTGSLSSHRNAVTRLTYRITDGYLGANIWLDDIVSSGGYLTNPSGSTISSSTQNRYFQYRAILSQNNLNAPSASLTSVTLDYVDNAAPETPTLDSPADTATNQLLYPALKTTTTDSDSNNIQYKIDLCTNSLMTIGCQTFDQSSSQTGWSGQNADGNTTYTSGTQAVFTIQSALSPNATYYWRSYAIDPSGTNTWSSTQATPYSFTTSTTPSTPTLDSPVDTVTNQSFYAVLKTTSIDLNSDNLKYKIQICTNSLMTTNCQTFDQTSSQTGWSGQNADGNTTYTSGTQATYTVQSALSPNTTYYWRSYAIDPAGTNTWSSTQTTPYSFTTLNAPLAASGCLIQESMNDNSLTVIWTDNATNEDYYEVQRSVDGGEFSVLDTTLPADTKSDIDNSISTGHTYQYRVAPYFSVGPAYAPWCVTPKLDLQLGQFFIRGLNLGGLEIK